MKERDRAPDGAPPEERLSLPERTTALGRNPLAEIATPDPFAERLEGREPTEIAPAPAPPRLAAKRSAEARSVPQPADRGPGRLPRRRWATTASLGELELPESHDWRDRVLGDHERRVLAAFAHLIEGEAPYDRYGFSPHVTKAAFPIFHALYRYYFRVRSEGHAHIPAAGPAILCANHGGLLPFDGAMAVTDVALHTDPPRLARALVDRWAGALPWINVFYARVGQVMGTRKNFADLLRDGQLVLVFPEGIDAVSKPVTQCYRLQPFRAGFVAQALRGRAPLVPTAIVGSEEQTPILYNLKSLAQRLGLPALPITPTFPWLGPLGLLPYPVPYRIVYGKPLPFHEEFGPEAADDSDLVTHLALRVRRTVQQLVDRSR